MAHDPTGGHHDGRRVRRPAAPKATGWLFRLTAPYVASFVVGASMRISNAKARAELGWNPAFPAYHDGIRAAASPAPAGREAGRP